MHRKKVIAQLLPYYLWFLAVGILLIYLFCQGKIPFILTSAEENARYFIIDAGHGGVDGGATSCSGVLESHINLQIALRLDDLMHLLGMNTVMIRTTDISVYTKGNTIAAKKISDLKERVRIANSMKNAVLISIHQNTFSQEKYSGAQVFYANTPGSRLLSENIQKEFIAALNKDSHRAAKPSKGVYLMDHILCTGVLIECGFLSNEQEDQLLQSAEYQKKICCVIAASCSNYTGLDIS